MGQFKTRLEQFTDRVSLEHHLALRIVQLLSAGIQARGEATLAVSGGKTPLDLFATLAKCPLEWHKVTVTLVDERWVNTDDGASNEKLVRERLLQHAAAAARFVGMKNEAESAFAGAAACGDKLASLAWPVDVMLLGMGDDGHTASLFPATEGLAQALALDSGRLCQAMSPPGTGNERMTLTLPALLNSRHLFLHLVGENKMATLRRARQGSDVEEMPVRAILQQRSVPLTVYYAP
ncbi:MAG: 6-phosphogluconolactonase [Enterobacteriaceae bacterium]